MRRAPPQRREIAMRSALCLVSVPALAAALSLAASAPASAQFLHHRPAPRDSAAPMQVNCDVVVANPNSGMDKASCEAMNQAAAAYYTAQHDPAGARPGDDAETCDQIKAEFMAQPVTAPSAEHVAAAQAATGEFMGKAAAIQGEATAAGVAGTVAQTAAAATEAVNPIAGRAAAAAVQASQQATEAALSAKAKAVLVPAEQKAMSKTASLIGDATPQLQSNPRMAHLIEMSEQKHCHGF